MSKVRIQSCQNSLYKNVYKSYPTRLSAKQYIVQRGFTKSIRWSIHQFCDWLGGYLASFVEHFSNGSKWVSIVEASKFDSLRESCPEKLGYCLPKKDRSAQRRGFHWSILDKSYREISHQRYFNWLHQSYRWCKDTKPTSPCTSFDIVLWCQNKQMADYSWWDQILYFSDGH